MIMDDIDTAIVSISISNPTRFFVPDVSMMSLCVCVCVCVCVLWFGSRRIQQYRIRLAIRAISNVFSFISFRS